jgi:hypothetical protein
MRDFRFDHVQPRSPNPDASAAVEAESPTIIARSKATKQSP